MGRERRKWTAAEDALLRDAVKKAIAESRPLLWRELAKSVPGRTNKDCRRRWWNSLSDNMMKGPWTESEDERLFNAVQDYGNKWINVAAAVGTRSSDQCSSHWSQTLNPGINHSDWTPEEDERLLQAVQRYGTNWITIASSHTPQRTTLGLKNRYTALRSKSNAPRKRPRPASRGSQTTNTRAGSERSTYNRRLSAATKSSETAGNTDDEYSSDDDEQDEELEDDGYIQAGDVLGMDWLKTFPVSIEMPHQAQPSLSNAESHDSAIFSGSKNDIQWINDALGLSAYPTSFPCTGADKKGYPLMDGQMRVLHPPSSPIDPTLDLFTGAAQYPTPEEHGTPPIIPTDLSPSSHIASSCCSHSLAQTPVVLDTKPDVQPAPGSERATHSTQGVPPSGTQSITHHVTIDAVCTNEQLGNILSTVAGLAKSVTVKVGI